VFEQKTILCFVFWKTKAEEVLIMAGYTDKFKHSAITIIYCRFGH